MKLADEPKKNRPKAAQQEFMASGSAASVPKNARREILKKYPVKANL